MVWVEEGEQEPERGRSLEIFSEYFRTLACKDCKKCLTLVGRVIRMEFEGR
jgi:hypothetical protein